MPRHTPDDLRSLANRIEQLDSELVDPTPADEIPDAVGLLQQQEALVRLHQHTSRHALVRARASTADAAHPFALACTHLSYALADLSLAIEHTLRQLGRSDLPTGAPSAAAPVVDRHTHRALARAHRRLGDAVETLRECAHSLAATPPKATPGQEPWTRLAQALASARPVTVHLAAPNGALAGGSR